LPEFIKITKPSLLRYFSVYVAIAESRNKTYLYVGKTGDNRDGCNPIISRIGNHFSYNKIHSQLRNKIDNHNDYEYSLFFENFFAYNEEDKEGNQHNLELINEMERWLNEKILVLSKSFKNLEFLNPQVVNLKFQSKKYKIQFQKRHLEYRIQLESLVNAISEYLFKSKVSKLDPKISLLFLDEPKQYGARGDDHLWKDMMFQLLDIKMTKDFLKTKSIIKDSFRKLTNHSMDEEDFYIKKYDVEEKHSKTNISTEAWRGKLMELLEERSEKIPI
jgi:hypothetical protein